MGLYTPTRTPVSDTIMIGNELAVEYIPEEYRKSIGFGIEGAGWLVLGAKLAKVGAAGVGSIRIASNQKLLTYSGKMADHHLFPRQFEVFFKERGINIDDYTVSTTQGTTHLKGIHGTGNMGQMPGAWNKKWELWIRNNPNATTKNIYQQAGKMMDEYNINNLRIHPYREKK